jgi:hypothetical protein
MTSTTVGVHPGHGRVGAHAAGVRSLIAVEDALVVLRRRHRHGPLAVAQREQGELLALEVLLDEHARVAEAPFHEHCLERGTGLVPAGRDDDALARGQPVGLEDDRVSVDRGQPVLHVAHEGGGRGGHPGGLHDLLGERLGSLEARGGGRRAEGRHPRLAQCVDEPGHERRLRPHDDEVDGLVARRRHQPVDVLRADLEEPFGVGGDPGVAGRRQELGRLR